MCTFASQTTSLTINFQSNENTHLQRGDKWQRLSVTLLRIKQCCNLHSNKCLRARYVSWICGQVWSHPIVPVVSPAFRFWEDINFQTMAIFIQRVRNIVHYMENPWFKGEHAHSDYFSKAYRLYLRANIPNFQPSTEDIEQVEELEATKPSIPCPFQ